MGEFFTPPKPEPKHRCLTPWQRGTGHWRCDCGKAYRWEYYGERERGVDSREPNGHWVRDPIYDVEP